jgi:hypothetical protein
MKPVQLQVLLLSMDFSDFSLAKNTEERRGRKKQEKPQTQSYRRSNPAKSKQTSAVSLPLFYYKRTKLIACEADEPDFLDCGYK